ncbi:MAG: hypothetical protein OR997_03190 [Methylophilaceae bacterium]|nr:hypothetical protein [Methylophilaceae bacterium]
MGKESFWGLPIIGKAFETRLRQDDKAEPLILVIPEMMYERLTPR